MWKIPTNIMQDRKLVVSKYGGVAYSMMTVCLCSLCRYFLDYSFNCVCKMSENSEKTLLRKSKTSNYSVYYQIKGKHQILTMFVILNITKTIY